MSEEKKVADEITEIIGKVFDDLGAVDQAKNLRIAWVHAAAGAQGIAMEALRRGHNLVSITITKSDDVGFEINYAVTESTEINAVSVRGKVSV